MFSLAFFKCKFVLYTYLKFSFHKSENFSFLLRYKKETEIFNPSTLFPTAPYQDARVMKWTGIKIEHGRTQYSVAAADKISSCTVPF